MGLVRAPELQASFDRYRYGWMAPYKCSYNSALVQEFYAYLASMIYLITHPEGGGVEKPQMNHNLVGGQSRHF